MLNRILQWNCRGLKANYEEILLLLKDYEPAALCLQETHLKDTDNISIRNYTAFHTFSANNERAAGGVSIFINNNAPHSHITLNTNLQAVAVSITLHRVITLCSIYIPPSSRLSPKDLDDTQLPSPFILWETLMVIISFGVPKILMIKAELLRVSSITTDFAFITQKLPRIYTQPLAHILL